MFNEDLTAFLGDFAIEATTVGGTFMVLFDDGYSEGAVGFAGMASTQPAAMARSVDVAGMAVGDEIVILGTAYSIAEMRPDGTGMVTLILEIAA